MRVSPICAAITVALISVTLPGGTAFGQESEDAAAPTTSPEPRPRPDPEARVPADEPEGDASDYVPEAAAPEGGTADDAAGEEQNAVSPDADAEEAVTDPEAQVDEDELEAPEASVEGAAPLPPIWERLAETDEQFAACAEALGEFGAEFETVEPIVSKNRDCGIARPIEVARIAPGVAMRPDTVLRCETALALARWVVDFAIPAAERLPERGELTGIAHGSSYICRSRNNAASGRLSEHSFGNAIDVMGFTFEDGSTLQIEPRDEEGTINESFQSAVRNAACLDFTTVLGPGTDAAHADHLHMDVKDRKGGYRLCQ